MKNPNDFRNRYLNNASGGKLIRVESGILGVVIFLTMATNNMNIWVSIITGTVIAFAFPFLLRLFSFLGWIATFLFSFLWAALAFSLIDLIPGLGFLPPLIAAAIVFIISYNVHKAYSGLYIPSMKAHNLNLKTIFTPTSTDDSADEFVLPDEAHGLTRIEEIKTEKVIFCPDCGRRIKSENGKCTYCDN